VAYQAQRTDVRLRLVAVYEERLALEQKRLAAAREILRDRESRSAIGIEGADAVSEARSKVSEAEAAVQLVELELTEVRLTGEEPVTSASAPLVSGRDFVSQRWQVELTVPRTALALTRQRLERAQVRFDVGMAAPTDVEQAGLDVAEVEAAIEAIGRKLEIRRSFLNGTISAAVADLRVLQAEAERQRRTFERRIDLAGRQLRDLQRMVEIGTLKPIELSSARLRLQELQLGLTKAAYDLELIVDQIRRHKE
jgi:outer membrane protein TolC